jgi:hypothetical protein
LLAGLAHAAWPGCRTNPNSSNPAARNAFLVAFIVIPTLFSCDLICSDVLRGWLIVTASSIGDPMSTTTINAQCEVLLAKRQIISTNSVEAGRGPLAAETCLISFQYCGTPVTDVLAFTCAFRATAG